MRIGIDARELCGRSTGVGRYLAGLLSEWAVQDQARGHEFVLYAPSPIILSLDAHRFPTRTVAGSGGTWWEQVQVPRAVTADHLDIWFGPAYTVPIRLPMPIVVAIHDLSFVAHPEWFSAREGVRRRWLTGQAARHADVVVTISEFSKAELIERLGVPQGKIRVVPPGVGSADSTVPRSPVPTSPRVLFVGSIFNRRHVTDLIRAFVPIARAHADASLDIVGDNRSYPREDLRRTIAAEQLVAQVRWHEYVSDHQLAGLYREASAFAFLSEYEGLGLTPLEALAAGVPPLLLDTPVARESCGAAALYVAMNDLPAITRALESLLFDADARQTILDAAPAELAKFSWARAGRETLAILEQCRQVRPSAHVRG
ncbi:MAG: glycosyltransferase family 4 protein [Vicinamibacterales bacterium]